MSAARLRPDVIERRLRDVESCLQRLDELGEIDRDRLAADWRLRALVERQLSVLVEAAVKLNSHVASAITGQTPDTYQASFAAAADAGALPRDLAAALAPSAGLRNVIVHLYDEIDVDKLAAGAASAQELYPRYVVHLARYVRDAAN